MCGKYKKLSFNIYITMGGGLMQLVDLWGTRYLFDRKPTNYFF